MHWIDSSTLKHHKAAIASTRMMGRHTYDVLAAKIESVHKSFGLSGKVSATDTDNGSNFVKDFATFSLPAPDNSTLLESTENAEVQDDTTLEEEEVTFADVVDLMAPDQAYTQDDLAQIEYELPPHQRCTACSDIIFYYNCNVLLIM